LSPLRTVFTPRLSRPQGTWNCLMPRKKSPVTGDRSRDPPTSSAVPKPLRHPRPLTYMGFIYKLQRVTSDRVQGIGYELDDPEFKFRQQQVINPFSKTSKPALEPYQLPVQRVMRALSLGGQTGRSMKFATLFQAPSVKNEWICTCILLTCLHGMHRYRFMYINTIFRMFSCHSYLVITLNFKYSVEFPLSRFILSYCAELRNLHKHSV
jgi:hypothetical protein